jgi:hypothetical protein
MATGTASLQSLAAPSPDLRGMARAGRLAETPSLIVCVIGPPRRRGRVGAERDREGVVEEVAWRREGAHVRVVSGFGGRTGPPPGLGGGSS